jgi:hypothetical protein
VDQKAPVFSNLTGIQINNQGAQEEGKSAVPAKTNSARKAELSGD